MDDGKETRGRDVMITFAGTLHFFLAGVVFNVYPVVASAVRESLNLSATRTGLLMSVASIAYAAMQIPVGLLSIRRSKNFLLAGSAILMGLGALMFALVKTYEGLAIARILMGIAAGFSLPTVTNLLSVSISEKRIPAAMAVFGSGWSIGTAFAFLVLSPVHQALGWRPTLFIVAGMCGILALVVAASLKGRERISKNLNIPRWNLQAVSSLLKTRGVVFLILILGTTLSTQIGLVTWVPSYLQAVLPSGRFVSGIIPVILGIAGGAASILGGAVGRRLGRSPAVISSMIGCVILPPLFILTRSLPAAVILMTITGWSTMFWWGSGYSMLPYLVSKEHTGAAMGFINGLAWVGGFLSPFLFGVTIDFSGAYNYGFLLIGILALAGTAGALFWRKELKSHSGNESE